MITIPLGDSLRMVSPFATMYQAYILRIVEWSLRHFSETIKLQFGGKCHTLLCLLKLLKFLLLKSSLKKGDRLNLPDLQELYAIYLYY